MLTTAQLTVLRAAILAETDPTFVAYRVAGSTGLMAEWLNLPSTYVVYKTSESVASVGQKVNYVAFEALTTANLEKINTFTRLNMSAFPPAKADIRAFWANVFSGALGGQGQATRDALEVLWRRAATRGERIFVTAPGTGTTLEPGTLTFEGQITNDDVVRAVNL